MAADFDLASPDQLTAEQRLDEDAAILAVGAARLLSLREIPTSPPAQIFPESSLNGLDECRDKSVHAPRG
jgi:hypothetical protein